MKIQSTWSYFLREIDSMMRLYDHPQLVSILKYGIETIYDRVIFWFTMPYAETTVDKVWERTIGDERLLWKWMSQVVLAVAAMHQKGIVHLDIKPNNLFLINGDVKLGDFGFARTIDDRHKGNIVHPAYRAPVSRCSILGYHFPFSVLIIDIHERVNLTLLHILHHPTQVH